METTPLLTRPNKKSFWSRINLGWFRRRELTSRVIYLGQLPDEEFPENYVCNQKYNIITFLPLVLYEQFKFFLNLYFLVMALSQFIPSIRIGYLYTYWGPLGFVLAVTLFREAIDDFRRYRRDKEVNRQYYERIILDTPSDGYRPFHKESVSASKLRVGDIVMLHKGQRVPADMILLRTNETMGTVFIRTDQLDGEIDWKLRIPLSLTQKLPTDAHLLDMNAKIFVEKPEKDIHSFIGTCIRMDEEESDSLDIENTLWSGCVVASGQATGLVIYTGSETRSVMNNAVPRSKVGRLDLQVNGFTKVLFVATMFTSFLMIVLKGFDGPWYGFMFRFVLLFSYIIPISLRVNLEMGKIFYAWTIQRDKKIEGTVMRTTTIPEEMGRIQYLLADKTGTLTKNEMVFQKLHMGNGQFDKNNFYEVEALLTQYVTNESQSLPTSPLVEGSPRSPTPRQVWETVLALALCHNVTPVYDMVDDQRDEANSDMGSSVMSESCGGAVPQQQLCDYQAASPDEVALVKWTDMMGLSLYRRDLHNISLKLRAANEIMSFTILQLFPFTSESKMMGIIVQEEITGDITYYVKGADVALSKLLDSTWLARECSSLAAEGLRTLVVAKRSLTKNEYLEFEVCLRSYEEEFVDVLRECSGVVVARCSPTQKARVAALLRARGLVVAAVGDGGNDVAMIQEADIGVGIEGAEGRAASLAGDVSVRSLAMMARLLLVHGRRSLMRSAALCLFIVHRGLIVSTMQAVFSVVFYFSSVSLYPGFLMVGYGTLFTMLPVFSLVLDKDISSGTALRYPQLYKQMTKGRQLSYKTFYIWIGISIYQGGVIMYGALVLFEDQLIHIVEISYTALILTELIMVALTVTTWHKLMVVAELVSLLMYTATLLIFTTYFDGDFIRHWNFWWKVTTITLVSCLPLYIVKYMHRKWRMRQYRNIRK
ncbi:probable phospholipid-transporting ATPase IIB isoform X2 [Leptidea sinapis]|uniref:probable phospholipid-transporting ATPase IIB isoform X2 n=1 Tax=Leptidea sinapis TaxID=189913 RepID=UPI0021355EA2|nr:probable phospholipid-transporting ATPase IIB isoform X2 [Leptidea sinapis]